MLVFFIILKIIVEKYHPLTIRNHDEIDFKGDKVIFISRFDPEPI